MITDLPRRAVARRLGAPDVGGAIPEARWVRALTFEKLVQQQPLATRFVTQALGAAGFARPDGVVAADPMRRPHGNDKTALDQTAAAFAAAHARAVEHRRATLIHTLTLPFPRVRGDATPVKPDFAVVAPTGDGASTLLMGDAKDYERVRSRIDDSRMLKGFLQVALGATAAGEWSRLPTGMKVSDFGVLAVPRNAFLQPTPVVEQLRDYCREVSDRIEERLVGLDTVGEIRSEHLADYVRHLEATFDPAACATCSLLHYCRGELRQSSRRSDVLIEIGIPTRERPGLAPMLDGEAPLRTAPDTAAARLRATLAGVAVATGQARVDHAGEPGAINVVLAKADGGSLGVHGLAVRRVPRTGVSEWDVHTYPDPLAASTRTSVMTVIGRHLVAALKDMRSGDGTPAGPVHLVVPDAATADLLVSVADNLAGIELSRLRWQRDLDQARPALTFDGEEADVPARLRPVPRTAVSFLLEADRSRALNLRSAVIDLVPTLRRSITAGGPDISALRLDYLVGWAETLGGSALDHRDFADAIEGLPTTPGARLTNSTSDEVFHVQTGPRADASAYDRLVRAELSYKQGVLDRALAYLATQPSSLVRDANREIERDAQVVWSRRHAFQANDLVRFGRVYDHWRNQQVKQIDADDTCARQLGVLASPHVAFDLAADVGNRDLLRGEVKDAERLVVQVNSRRLRDGDEVVLLHVNGSALVDASGVAFKAQKGSLRFDGMPVATVGSVGDDPFTFELQFAMLPTVTLSTGDRLALARYDFFGTFKNRRSLSTARPGQDEQSSPKATCGPSSYADDPVTHRWCCRPHADAEAEWSDELAERRKSGLLNPQVWPPALDEDGFEVTGRGMPTQQSVGVATGPAPEDLSLSDID